MAGLLSFLSGLGFLFAQAAAAAPRPVATRLQRIAAETAAASGVHYAMARLREEPRALDERGIVAEARNACDDWKWRGDPAGEPAAMRPSASLNPSYRRGEHWSDDNGDGHWQAKEGEEDLDGNGRPSPWSGRLRGDGLAGEAFSLVIRSTAGLVCVNSGALGSPLEDWNMNGILDADDPPGFSRDDRNTNGVPDWRDPDYLENRHLVSLLDNLGVVLKAASLHGYPRELYAPAPRDEGGYDWSQENQEDWEDDEEDYIDEDGNGIPDGDQDQFSPRSSWDVNSTMSDYVISNLGRRIILGRPRGGYADIGDLKRVLGQAVYDRVRPFLTTRGEIVTVLTNGPLRGSISWDDRIVEGEQPNGTVPFYERRARMELAAVSREVLEASLMYLSAGGCRFIDGQGNDDFVYETAFSRIHRVEAKSLADFIGPKAARGEITSWAKLLELLAASGCFIDDPFTETARQFLPQDRQRLKEDLILAVWNANDHFPDFFSRSRNSLDVPRGGRPRARRITAASQINSEWIWTRPYGGEDRSSNYPIEVPGRPTATFDLMGGGPRSFEVDSEGWQEASSGSRAVAGDRSTVDLLGALTLTGQQDFEQHPTGGRLWRKVGGEVFHDPADGRGERSNVSTYPSISTQALGPSASYPRAWGDLRLASAQRAGDEDGAILSVCFNESKVGDPLDRHHVNARADGALLAPCGVRHLNWMVGGDDELASIVWQGEGQPPQGDDFFCLPRSTLRDMLNSPPRDVPGSGEITRGAIAFWMPGFDEYLTARIDGILMDDHFPYFGGTRIEIRVGRRPRMGPFQWLDPAATCAYRVSFTDLDNLREHFQVNGFEAQLPHQGASGHHVVLVFNDDGEPNDHEGTMDVYVDGEPWGPRFNIDYTGCFPLAKFVVQSGPVDDIFFFDRVLLPQEIRDMADDSIARFPSPSGTYTSPVYTFDPARLPEGATLQGLSWDAFFPAPLSGTLTFCVTGFRSDGSPVSSEEIVYTSDDLRDGRPQHQWLAKPLYGCRKVQITVRIDVDSGGPLFDTPVIDEIRLLYRAGR